MPRKSKLAEILAEVAPSPGVEDTILSGYEAARLIRRAYRAGRASVEQGELLAVGWADATEANYFKEERWIGVNAERVDRDRIKVEVRRAKA